MKKFFKKFIIFISYLATIYFLAGNKIINNFIISVFFDTIIVGLFFESKSRREKLIISHYCKNHNYFFNEDYYDSINKFQIQSFKSFILSAGIFLPYSKKLVKIFPALDSEITNIHILDKINKITDNILCDFIFLFIITIIWILTDEIIRYIANYNKLKSKRENRNEYNNLDKKYSIYIGDYSEEELKIINNNKLLINNISENNDSENISEENSGNQTEETETNLTVPEEE